MPKVKKNSLRLRVQACRVSAMRPYICFYNGKKIEVRAESSFAAQKEAARILKVSEKNRYKITPMLADVEHSTANI